MERQSTVTLRELECMLCDETAEPKALPLSLLEEITDGFSDDEKIGRGGFAVVYKGKLDNRTVAVKKMVNTYMHEKEFQQEVECLMMVKHKNVVRFLGYCADRQGSMEIYNGKFVMADVHQRLLCFEFLPRGSLHEYISGTSNGLRWRERYHIITGICQGLHYLHKKDIVHLDLKPSNILLDDNLIPKIADFGLSRCFAGMQSRVITVRAATFGYMAPEFCDHTEITYRHSYRLDIYSLGVIIIEILTGKKGYHAVENVVESWSNMLERSQSDVQLDQVRVCAEIGLECTNFNPAKRPDTQYIISRLKETETVDGYIKTDVITSQQAEDAPIELHQDTANKSGETSYKLPSGTDVTFATVDKFTLGSMLAQDQLFTIIDFSPNWTYASSRTRVLVTGRFLTQTSDKVIKWSCMFGEVEVPAEILAEGTLRCYSPSQKPGRVPFYVTCSNRLPCSEVREFEYRPSGSQRIGAPRSHDATNKAHFQIRLGKLLSLGQDEQDEFQATISNRTKELIDLKKNNDQWSELLKLADANELVTHEKQDTNFESQFENCIKDKLDIWLLHYEGDGGKGLRELDEGGQGVLHLAAALGYYWALEPTITAGVHINFTDAHGWTALHWAAFCGRGEAVAVLLALGADCTSASTPADLASFKGHKGLSAFLSEASLTVHLEKLELVKADGSNASSSDSNSPLMERIMKQ